jgi:1-pyrroline-5-carboxylate dehydrogenase
MGQTSTGLRWPFGPVAVIAPFNFPLEIPALQLMGALYMGNKPLLHVDQKVGRFSEHCSCCQAQYQSKHLLLGG